MTTNRVTATRLSGTEIVIYRAWRETDGLSGRYLTVTFFDGRQYGQVGRERIPAAIDALPAHSDERSDQYRGWRESTYRDAYRMIYAAFPRLNGRESDGEIVADAV